MQKYSVASAIRSGPLEATIHNLQRDIATKTSESSALERQWLGHQAELVAAQVRPGLRTMTYMYTKTYWMNYFSMTCLCPMGRSS